MIAQFIAEEWINDNAVEIDPKGPTEWDCTIAFFGLEEDYRASLLEEIDAFGEALDSYDRLKDDIAAPQWVRDHDGPFTIHVRVEE